MKEQQNMQLILFPKGDRSFKLKYHISFSSGGSSHGINTITLTEMFNKVDAVETFRKYLNFLFSTEEVNLLVISLNEYNSK